MNRPRCNPFKSSSEPKNINGRIQPNGRAGFAVERQSRRPPVDHSDLRSTVDQWQEFDIKLFRQYGADVLRKCKEGDSPLVHQTSLTQTDSKKPRSSRGSGGLTAHGRSVVMNAIDYLQWRFGRRSLAFATVTIPAIDDDQMDDVVEKWSEIINRFTKKLRRILHVQNLPDWIVGAYENQPRRSHREGRPCLHFHFVFVGRRFNGAWRLTRKEIRQEWRASLVSVIPSLSDCDYRAVENVVGVRKSVTAYIAKYLTKGSGAMADVATGDKRRHPASWWSCSLALKRIVSRSVRCGRFVGTFLSRLDEEYWLFKKAVKVIDSSGHECVVGWFGQLKPGWSQLLDVPIHIPIEESNPNVFQFPLPKVFHDGFFPIVLSVGLCHHAL